MSSGSQIQLSFPGWPGMGMDTCTCAHSSPAWFSEYASLSEVKTELLTHGCGKTLPAVTVGVVLVSPVTSVLCEEMAVVILVWPLLTGLGVRTPVSIPGTLWRCCSTQPSLPKGDSAHRSQSSWPCQRTCSSEAFGGSSPNQKLELFGLFFHCCLPLLRKLSSLPFFLEFKSYMLRVGLALRAVGWHHLMSQRNFYLLRTSLAILA